MKKYLEFLEKGLVLLNFDELLREIEVNCLNDLEEFGLVQNYTINLSKRDVKKIIYHNIIHGICEEVLKNKSSLKTILLVPPEIKSSHEITEYCDNKVLYKLLRTILHKLRNSMPFVIYFTDNFVFDDEINDSGEIIELLSIVSEMSNVISNKNFTFEKIKKLSTTFELNFLSKEYFNNIKTKLLLH